jgi:hypothetical protein
MSGAASQCDTFDYKPELIKRHGEKFDPGGKVELFQSNPGACMKSPWDWKQYGQCGKWISDLVPHLATCVDDIAFIHSMVHEVQRPWSCHVYAKHGLRAARASRAWAHGSRMDLGGSPTTFQCSSCCRTCEVWPQWCLRTGRRRSFLRRTRERWCRVGRENPIHDLFPANAACFHYGRRRSRYAINCSRK